ncbi:RNA dependent RNA polymerase-domain-containing protein [Auriculariales sp. MPI-PUGE-AT-0066]|nr:RNA dependent RNA polymerase-domain-containing protein [Auriculariales sp. MPI-PUGE-AT-0066]
MRELELGVPASTDTEWRYTISNLTVPPRHGKFVVFTSERILFRTAQFSDNRILHNDDPSLFVSVNFKNFRMPEYTTVDYIRKFLASGLWINNRQYRFYHHSNSQLRERSCYLRAANSDAELDERIYKYGDFERIKNLTPTPGAKRIGLLFSSASIDYSLPPTRTQDIDDITIGEENFSDGCGLMSKTLAISLSKRKKIVFRGARYVPSVFQIRYLGYKGVLMLHPDLDKASGPNAPLAQFRKSMKKFNATIGPADRPDHTFSVVAYSEPYAFGRLNNDIIVLISSLGITNETLLKKQQEYFDWLLSASKANNLSAAVDLLSSLGEYTMAERAILDGLDSAAVQRSIASLVSRESRLLFGVCDPYGVLREGEVYVRISNGRQPATTLTHCDVMVIRNPCLHPGDVIKLRTVDNPKLSHLVDCVALTAIGDKFTVCWDPDIVPSKLTTSYTYPPGKERVSERISRQDLAAHFAAYTGASVASVARLHDKWARYSPLGTMSPECQELNALHSLAVDGGRIKIPQRLKEPPEGTTPYIIDELAKAAAAFADCYLHGPLEASEMISQILGSEQHAFSEWELVQRCMALARKHRLDFTSFLPQQKYALASALHISPEENARMWNRCIWGLFRSDILREKDLRDRNLDRPLRLQRYFRRAFKAEQHSLNTCSRLLAILSEKLFSSRPQAWPDVR